MAQSEFDRMVRETVGDEASTASALRDVAERREIPMSVLLPYVATGDPYAVDGKRPSKAELI